MGNAAFTRTMESLRPYRVYGLWVRSGHGLDVGSLVEAVDVQCGAGALCESYERWLLSADPTESEDDEGYVVTDALLTPILDGGSRDVET